METIKHDVANQEGENQNPLPSLKPMPQASSLLRENVESSYQMPHYNHTQWQIIQERIQRIANGDATWEDIIGTISLFTNDEQFQSNYRTTQTNPMDNMLDYFWTQLDEDTKIVYQKDLFPRIAKLILETEELFPIDKRIPIFTQDDHRIGSLSKRQCACLIAHMVFCISVDQADNFKLAKVIDFSAIYQKSTNSKSLAKKVQKIKCTFAYLKKFLDEDPQGDVVFQRLPLEGIHNGDTWADCDEKITKAEIIPEGNIEDQQGDLQVIFSDSKLGDHTLQIAITQQQSMCLIHPEMLLTLLFFEELKEDETARVYGAGRYLNHKGYGDTFELTGDYIGDNLTERFHLIMDAYQYKEHQAASQFGENWLVRELRKAYCGFNQEGYEDGRRVATGKWGCKTFKGNPQLKFLIQWMAASRANREIWFCSYGDIDNFKTEEKNKILKYYTGKEVRELYKDLRDVTWEMQTIKDDKIAENKNLFEVLIAHKGL